MMIMANDTKDGKKEPLFKYDYASTFDNYSKEGRKYYRSVVQRTYLEIGVQSGPTSGE